MAALLLSASIVTAGTPEYGYQVIHVYPHDTSAFTEGLFYLNGILYESTGEEGRSSVRKVKLETGEVIEKHQLAPSYFGEGIVNWRDHILQLTWISETGFVYDLETFREQKQFHYPGEGWALTQDGKRIIMDDGSAQIRFWDPDTLKEIGRITVTDHGQPVKNLNELEWVNGEIFANVWHTDRIARIDPTSGKVVGWIDLSGLLRPEDRDGDPESVLNGIAYDSKGDRLFVTGKRWPKLFEIRVTPYRMSVK
ncbi:MAG: glutaminyl-peptide cyclotransferase [Acidobacteriota bacterium]|nr:glutaminyl-peptide cyclotransferase [Acidobacteriota bacterium]